MGSPFVFLLGVADLVSQRPAAVAPPGVELTKEPKLLLAGVDPDAPPAVLNPLRDNAPLPATGVLKKEAG